MMNKNFASKSYHSPQSCAIKIKEKNMLESVETSLTTMDTIDSPQEPLVDNQLNSIFSFQTNNSSEKLSITTLKNLASQASMSQCYPISNISQQELFSKPKSTDQIFAKQQKPKSFYQSSNQSNQQLISELGLQKLTQIQHKNELIAIQDKSDDDEDIYDSDEEEEYSIWEDDELRSLGIDTNFFIDIRGEELSFYQIYRLRSALYQPSYISRLDTIKEVQIISQHYDQEIPINDLRTQQIYLDQFYQIQTKEFPRNQIKKIPQIVSKPIKQDEKCLTERIQRVVSHHEQKDIVASKQSNNLPKVNHQVRVTKFNQKELSQKQSNSLKNQESHTVITQKLNENYDAFSQAQNFPLNQKLRSQRRQKVSIDQEQALKLIQDKKVPIKQIKLYEENSSQINEQTENKNQINQLQSNTNNACQKKVNNEQKSMNAQKQEQRQTSIQETASSVLQYLKGIIYNKKNQEQQQSIQSERITPHQKQNLIDQNISSPRNLKIEINQLNSKQNVKLQYQKLSQNYKMQQQQQLCSQLAK
ncbi:hypothetical protein ABPG74_006439 [Tetrahymena malaccensis]